jgi:hypothetical protein
MSETDPEIAALTTLIRILEPLTVEQRARVLGFVFHKLNIQLPGAPGQPAVSHLSQSSTDLQVDTGTGLSSATQPLTDIRSLRDAKQPRTANEMAALVAYYLEHVATGRERRDFITPEDIKPYFNQAGFPLPTAPARITLANAKTAGYLNARDRGQYKLNAVGYNLIAYKLPADSVSTSRRSTKQRSARKPRRKKVKG